MSLTGSLFCREYPTRGLTLRTFHCVTPIALRPSSTWMNMKWVSGCLVWLETIGRGFTRRLDLQLCSYLRALKCPCCELVKLEENWYPPRFVLMHFFFLLISFTYHRWSCGVVLVDRSPGIWHRARNYIYPVGQQFSVSRWAVRCVANNTSGSKGLQTIYLFVCFLIRSVFRVIPAVIWSTLHTYFEWATRSCARMPVYASERVGLIGVAFFSFPSWWLKPSSQMSFW